MTHGLQPDDIIVYVDGAFDLFHVGHIDILREAKKLGTYLIVGVHSDQTVNKKRGNGYPIMNLHERVLGVLSCRVRASLFPSSHVYLSFFSVSFSFVFTFSINHSLFIIIFCSLFSDTKRTECSSLLFHLFCSVHNIYISTSKIYLIIELV
jgi:cytidyltransferase-like protein